MKLPNSPAAMKRVDLALNEIQEAQRLMGHACQTLSSLRFGSPKYDKAKKLYDKIHAFWYELKHFSDQPQSLTVDSEPEATAPKKKPIADTCSSCKRQWSEHLTSEIDVCLGAIASGMLATR